MLIECRECSSPDCKGCNLMSLSEMLKGGKFDCIKTENNFIDETFEIMPVRHGHWLADKENSVWKCSECGKNPTYGMGYTQASWNLFAFCPNCGAKMDEEVTK